MAEITLAEFAADTSANYDTLYRKAKRKFPSVEWHKDAPLSADHISALSGNRPAPRPTVSVPTKPREQKKIIRTTQPITVNQPAPASEVMPPAPERAKFEWPTFGLSEFLAVAVYGHTALVWYEVALIFGTPGILAGVVLFALKHCAVVVVRSEKFSDYHSDAFGVAFVLDALAVWVHFTAFGDAMPDRFKDGAEFWAALILGLVVASGAFVSLYFTNKTSLK